MSDSEDEYQEAVDMFPEDSPKRVEVLADETPRLRTIEPISEPFSKIELDEEFVVVSHRADCIISPDPIPPPADQDDAKPSRLKELAWSVGKDVLIQAGSLLLQTVILEGTAGGFITAVGIAGVSRLMSGSSDIRCGRCGYTSHTTAQCFAVRNIYGAFIPKR
jgi:hypothetical protein